VHALVIRLKWAWWLFVKAPVELPDKLATLQRVQNDICAAMQVVQCKAEEMHAGGQEMRAMVNNLQDNLLAIKDLLPSVLAAQHELATALAAIDALANEPD
jgi:hypothetical protein